MNTLTPALNAGAGTPLLPLHCCVCICRCVLLANMLLRLLLRMSNLTPALNAGAGTLLLHVCFCLFCFSFS